ncbi:MULTISPECIES: NAD(P)-dependent oxidoreductase [Roseobacteraceae]|uniref:Glyoxylate/hydroxypyruvate reductase A n=1 Tax=Pseudosulfitobacter pseudonitzschiae TaxID=1402135 RepID=A0A221K2U2_9RHOB|nr:MULTISPECIES: NAD(P)-dependent oxidoreductase [Roseobacteraceae]ASM73316.1 glyoxylate/hydroxypyruvate reductase A [Pseudosulfitobacter pseudonitzschiae]
MTRWTGVATCSVIDLMHYFAEPFAQGAPEITLLPPERVDDPRAVDFVLTFNPADDTFTPYPNLRAVFSAGAGTDAIMGCPSLPDVPVHRVEDPDQALQMAGFAAFHVVWHHRRMGDFLAAQNRHDWARRVGDQSPTLRRIGVMGYGLMGRAIANGLAALGYRVTTLSRKRPDPATRGISHMTTDQIDAFLGQTDILINVLPLTPQTTGLLAAPLFAALPQGAALIQLGRGAHLVENDLIAALDSGHLSGASLDVFDTEPLSASSPLWDHPGIFVTPHVASTPQHRAVVENVRRGLGKLDTPVGLQPASASRAT